jgi:myosin-5
VFGNAKTVKNDNSSRFGKLIILDMHKKTFKIRKSSVKNYFLEKSRIILQNPGERNFHIFYQLLAYLPEEQKSALRLKNGGYFMRHDGFKYLTNRNSSVIN